MTIALECYLIIKIMQVIEILREISLFRGLNNQELLKVSRICQKVAVKAGKVIFKAGDPGDALYCLHKGAVQVIKAGEKDEPEELIYELGGGEIFGEMALFEDMPRSATIKAKTDCSLLRIPRDYFEKLISSDKEIALKIYQALNLILTHRLRETTERLAIANRIIRASSKGSG